MAHLYAALRTDNCCCKRCGRLTKLFGIHDIETGWFGWCSVCNADWRVHCVVGSCRCCSRACSVASPVLCGLGCGFSCNIAMRIHSHWLLEGSIQHRVVMQRHKRKLQTLEWTCACLDWFLDDDSDEELALDEKLTLSSLRHVYRNKPLHCFENGHTLLDAIYTYVTPALPLDDCIAVYHAHQEQTTWELFHWQGRFWLWENRTAEWFFVDEPPKYWRRYCWFVVFHEQLVQ